MNKNIEIKKDFVRVKINSKIYSKDVLTQTAYVLIEKYYFLIDVIEDNFIVIIKPKKKTKSALELEKIAFEFFEELIESISYINQLKKTSKLREIILQRALLTQKTNNKNN